MPRKYKKNRRKQVPKYVKQYVQNKISSNLETKRIVSNVSELDIDSTGTQVDILNISLGTQYYERIGQIINCTGFYGKFQMTGGDATNVIRAILYIPKDPSLTLTGLNTYAVIDPNVATILYDKVHTTTLNGPNTKIFEIKKKFFGKGLRVEWSATGSIHKNRLRLAFVSDSGAVSHPELSYHWIAYYKDA